MLLETTTISYLTVIGLFIPSFLALWVFVLFILSRMGWARLAEKYAYDQEFNGTNIGAVSARINMVNYNGTLLIQYNTEGIYLRPVIFFRLFHKSLLIPWKEIKEVKDRTILFFTYKELVIGEPYVAAIKLSRNTYGKFESTYKANVQNTTSSIR